jgi:acyl-CoA synthetase (AMP-forming)/AMP-acid ligase II
VAPTHNPFGSPDSTWFNPGMGSGPEARSLVDLWESRARLHPEQVAVWDDTRELTYADLASGARDCAAALATRGIEPGDRVLLLGRNTVSWVVAAFGVLRAGAVLAPLGHGVGSAERAHALRDLAPRLVVAEDPDDPGWAGVPLPEVVAIDEIVGVGIAADPPAVDPRRPALVLATSGTTGQAAHIPMTHEQLLRLYTDVSERVGVVPEDRLLGVVPLSHSFGFNGVLLIALVAGASVRLVPEYDATRTAELLRAEELTVLAGPPTLFHDLQARAEPGSGSARIAITGSTEVSAPRIRAACAALGIGDIVVGYGLTETCGTVAIGRMALDGDEERPLMEPVGGVDVRVVDDSGRSQPAGRLGRIEVRGFNVAVPTGDWLDTGDVGRFDDQGRLCVEARSKDTVVVSGFNVIPREVEEALLLHASVSSVAVVGVPDERQGEQLVACVVPAPGVAVSEEELVAHGRSRLAAYKVPRRFLVLDRLPTTSTGKLSRARLRELVSEMREPVP